MSASPDWQTDYDVFAEELADDPYPIMAELRAQCPVAHSDRHEGSWWPTRYEDVTHVANDSDEFSSSQVSVVPLKLVHPGGVVSMVMMDPPEHTELRRLLMPFFSANNAERYRDLTRSICQDLLAGMSEGDTVDVVSAYTRQIPPRIIAAILGVDPVHADDFTEWAEGILGGGMRDPEEVARCQTLLTEFLQNEVVARQESPGDDLISELLAMEVDGEPLSPAVVFANMRLMLIAGVDTTWSAMGTAIWHLALNPDDRHSLVDSDESNALAVEELLRAYAPVTMARIAKCPVQLGDAQIETGDRVLLSFPAANRDPDVFPEPETVQLDRTPNRHVAFGYGQHRCLGAPLARLELQESLRELVKRFPDFRLADPRAVTWSGGQVRGPRALPLVLG